MAGEREKLEQSQAASASAQAAARLAAIIESSDDAIISKNLDGIIQTWNQGAERIFGWRADEIIGKSITVLMPPDRQSEEPGILARIRAGDRVEHFQTVRMRKDGRLINVSVTISPVFDEDGKIIAASKIARDITHEKEIERELQLAKEAAESANRAKDQFLSVLSHELRTPLTPVLAAMNLLETTPNLQAEVREQVEMIRRNIETEARLVDDLLDATRIARGTIKLNFETVDAHEAIRRTVAMMQNEIDRKMLEISVALHARKHYIRADAGRLQQVILNLLSNAVKFTPEGGSLWIRTNDEGSHIRIEIRDNGVGMDNEMCQRLFKAFEQHEDSRKLGGLGLGLSIAKSLVEMHNGTIEARSPGIGLGASFILELGTCDPSTTAASAVIPQVTRRWRLLLVEDHADTRRVLARLLEMIGCEVVVAATVKDAIKLAEKTQFDLLISDIGLPDGLGTEIIRYVKKHQDLRGIALSGYGQEDDIKRSREAGFDVHLIKPVNFQALRDAVQRVLN